MNARDRELAQQSAYYQASARPTKRHAPKAGKRATGQAAAYQAAARPVVKKKSHRDPVIGFISSAAKAVANVEHKHNEKMREELKGSKHGTPIGDFFGKFVGNAAHQAKAVYKAVDRYGDDRWNDVKAGIPGTKERAVRDRVAKRDLAFLRSGIISQEEYNRRHPPVASEISPGMASAIVRSGIARVAPKLFETGAEQVPHMAKGLPRLRARELQGETRDPGRYGGVYDVGPRIPKDEIPGWVSPGGIRVPFLVSRGKGGSAYVGNPADEHASIYKALGINTRHLYNRDEPELRVNQFTQGWLKGHDDPLDDISIELGWGPWGGTHPQSPRGPIDLVRYLLRHYTDDEVNYVDRASPFHGGNTVENRIGHAGMERLLAAIRQNRSR